MDFNLPFSFLSYYENLPYRGRDACYSRGRHARSISTNTVYKRDLFGHYGCVNAIEFSSDGGLIASGGDDRRLLVWNLWKTILEDRSPLSIDTPHISNVNSCCFDNTDKKVITGGNDGQVIVHDLEGVKSTSVYGLSDAVYCISPDPVNATILATATDEGKVQIIDTRTSVDSSPVTLADTGGSMHSVMYNNAEPRILATANSKYGVAIWDIRMPLKSLNYKSNIHNCMSVRFNSRGDRLLALRRRAPPVLYDIAQTQPIYQFDHDTYYNACTLKSGCFAGLQDEFVVSGSDDFCIYLWKIPDNPDECFNQSEPHSILKGHRSIVNQVRYCHHNQMIISSGVEKLIKVWSPYPTPNNSKDCKYSKKFEDVENTERNAYSHEEYIHMVLRAGSFLSHDYTNGNTQEEPCMIAFFDSLIQREVEQNLSESDKFSHSSDSSSEEGQGERLMDQSDNSLIFGVEDYGERSGRSSIIEERRLSQSSSNLGGPDSESQGRSGRLSNTSRVEEISRLSYLEDESSSDSGSEVDGILSAMYNRYMHSREQTENPGPTGKKISSVIAQGKYKDKNKNKGHVCKQRLQHIGENLQHSDDQYLRDNARNLSILADVIDNFVDNLVASDSSTSRNVSNTVTSNDIQGGTTNSVISSTAMHPSFTSNQTKQQQGDPRGGNSSTQTEETNSSSLPSLPLRVLPRTQLQESNKPPDLEPGKYFIPELEAFAPRSLHAALNREQNVTSSSINGQGPSQTSSINGTSPSTTNSNTNKNCVDASKRGARSYSSSEENNSTSDTEKSALNLLVQSADVLQFELNFSNGKMPSKKQTRSSSTSSVQCLSLKHSCSVTSPSTSSSTLSSAATSSSLCNYSSTSSSGSSNTAALTIPHLCTSVKYPLLSPKLKTKCEEDLSTQLSFPIKEACLKDTKEVVAFKKFSKIKNKKRRFRIHKIGDSSSSSEEDSL